MKVIDTRELVAGTISEAEYYNTDGEMLIARGVAVTQKHLDALGRRNIFTLYIRESESEHEIEELLSRELEQLSALELDETAFSLPPQKLKPKAKFLEISLPELRDIKKGAEGLAQLVKSKRAAEIDYQVERGFLPDKPVGTPLAETMVQMTVQERTDDYKSRVAKEYFLSVNEVRKVLTSLSKENSIAAGGVFQIVERLMKTFVNDRNILLNLASIKPLDDDYLYNHSLNVCLISMNIAASSGYNEKQVTEIGLAALLHDVGMLLIPAEIRLKDGRLTPDEWYEVQKHPVLGLHLLERIPRLPPMVPIVVYQSHERENGSGYPRQRNSRLIHAYSKVIHCADIYEASSAPRSYRPAMPPYTCMEKLVKMARQGLLNGDFVKAFLYYASLFPVGSIVELSDRRVGRVIATNGGAFTKPWVSILVDANGHKLPENEIYQIDLKNTPETQISQSLPYSHIENMALMLGF
jgi:HD-GYP domain-containing protein (c-di-GMP phosphodiesterase class II)